jgi:uncharacterized protein (DUF305 family)/Spy/CpxP family protein refolding chaperone
MRITHTLAAAAIGAATLMPVSGAILQAQEATPAAAASCEDAASPIGMGTPGAMPGIHGLADTETASPMAGVDHAAMGLDLMYIDMMIPHHASIVAMAQAASPRLEDARLGEIAQEIIAAQTVEIDELREMRDSISGNPAPMPMDDAMMAAMDELMPGMSGPMEEMAFQMDAAAQVAAICAAQDTDLTFIDLTIPHHRMAIEASKLVVERSERAELLDFALRVIDAQGREIDLLMTIRGDLIGAATPATGGGKSSAHDGSYHAGSSKTSGSDDTGIRALPTQVLAQIRRGEGAGLALPAERNGVPGPRHVLDLAAELELTEEQRTKVQSIYDAMRSAAIPAGERYLIAQGNLEADFRAGAMDAESLPARVAEVSQLQGELAAIHLAAHLQSPNVLTDDQVAAYVALRSSP